jgi:NAD(P)-dependent dehydrogenase (short-subunit alcohol dehydrogenase family)
MATSTPIMQGKVCLITGANSGIGKQTALGLAKMGATVVLVCRDQSRGEAAQAEIKAHSGNHSVDLLLADFASQASIRHLVEEVHARYPKLHVLVNNAGVSPRQRTLTVDGLEANFAVNHLAPFLLTQLLLDLLKASAPARIVFVASSLVRPVDFEDLQAEKKYSAFGTYGQSKLAVFWDTFQFSQRLEGTGVTVNCLHPGVVNTRLARDFPLPFRVMARLFFISAAKGAQTSIYLASSPEVEGITGNYFIKCRLAPPPELAQDEASAKRLWHISEELTDMVGR